MKKFLLLLLLVFTTTVGAWAKTEKVVKSVKIVKADKVVVSKTQKKLYLINQGVIFQQYPVVFGPKPWGHKVMVGDERTPEGLYYLDYKKEHSQFYKSIHISYPNREDIKKARLLGVDPGGNIMIHGFPAGPHLPVSVVQLYNWTDGCIALKNEDMDAVWKAIEVGTPIEILP